MIKGTDLEREWEQSRSVLTITSLLNDSHLLDGDLVPVSPPDGTHYNTIRALTDDILDLILGANGELYLSRLRRLSRRRARRTLLLNIRLRHFVGCMEIVDATASWGSDLVAGRTVDE